VYRTATGLEEKELAVPEYGIDEQEWLARPRESRQPMWTEPYYDAGGGEIWMMTRSVPLQRDGKVYAVITTDLPVAPPDGATPPR
jgi:phosphoserine phosphatase RsbU/P